MLSRTSRISISSRFWRGMVLALWPSSAAVAALDGALSPSQPVVGKTEASIIGTARPGATVTMYETWPDGTNREPRTTTADAAGAFRIGPFRLGMCGKYMARLTDSIAGEIKDIQYSGLCDFVFTADIVPAEVSSGQAIRVAGAYRSPTGFTGQIQVSVYSDEPIPGTSSSVLSPVVTMANGAAVNASFLILTTRETTPGRYQYGIRGRNGSFSTTTSFFVDVLKGSFPPFASLLPSTPVVGVTDVVLSGDASPNATVTGTETWPDGSVQPAWTATADEKGLFRRGVFRLHQLGMYRIALLDSVNKLASETAFSGTGDFEVSSDKPSVSLTGGRTENVTLTIRSKSGFAGPVTPYTLDLPAGVTASFSPFPVLLASNGTASATATLRAEASATAGTYAGVRLQGRNGSVARSVPLSVTVSRSGLTAALSAANPVVGVTEVFLTGSAMAGGTVTAHERWPDGVTTRTRAGAADASGAFLIGPFRLEQLGTYSTTVQDSSGGEPRTLTYSGSGDFDVTLSAPRQTVAPGQTATYTATFRSVGGFGGEVSLSAQGWTAAAGAAGAWTQGSVMVPPNGSATASFGLQTSSATPLGVYDGIVLSGRNGSVSHSAAATLAVSSAGGAPTFEAGGIVSAASFTPTVARGSVVSLFGSSLAGRVEEAGSVPLPRMLGGVRVSVDGVDAPLWFVSPGQINFQWTFESPLLGMVPVRVIRDGTASETVNVQVHEYAPGIFTYQRTPGVSDPIVTHADGTLVTPENPAAAGEVLIVFGTGLGNLTVLPRSGEPSPAEPPAQARTSPEITLGGVRVEVQFAGLTPGGIGLAQFNIKLPGTLPAGTRLPLVIQFGEARSKAVELAVR